MITIRFIPSLSIALGVAGGTWASSNVAASQATLPLVIDGKLDEADWATSPMLSDLIQSSPNPGQDTPYKTIVKILVTKGEIVIGADCQMPAGMKPQSSTFTRDGQMGSDDHIAFVFDTFRDGRTGYLFRVNSAGTRQDGLIGGSEDAQTSWDAEWEAKTHLGENGWTAEIKIPLTSLRYKQSSDSWGFNIERFVAADRLTLRWMAPGLNFRLTELREAGTLSGLAKLLPPPKLSITPYVVGKIDQDLVNGKSTILGNLGADLTYNFSSQWTGVFTVNPDFAETEVDERQIRRDRFPLFFPEKRKFFLEGSNQFNFGLGSFFFIPFYSRRIGLFGGEVIPIEFGAKIVGKSGPLGVAALMARTVAAGGADRSTMAAGRFTYDFDKNLRLGTLITSGSPSGRRDNTMVAIDAVYRSTQFMGNQNLRMAAWYARTDGDIAPGDRQAFGAQIDYPNQLWDFNVRFDRFGRSLRPELGYLTRPGERFFSWSAQYQHRPKTGSIQRMAPELNLREWSLLSGGTATRRLVITPIDIDFQSGDNVEFSITPTFERLDDPFEVADGIEVPVGNYETTRYRAEFRTSSSRPIILSQDVTWGAYFNGRLTESNTAITFAPKGANYRLRLSGELAWNKFGTASFRQDVYEGRVDYSLSADRTLSALLQYDSESRDFGLNLRYRHQIEPGSDLFVVWNRNWLQREGEGFEAYRPTRDLLAVKFTRTFRF